MNQNSQIPQTRESRHSRRAPWQLAGLSAFILVLGLVTTQKIAATNGVLTPADCYALTLSHEGQGSNPTATPAKSTGCGAGQYVAGEQITLTAVPAAGWHVAGWVGTDDNAGTSITNTLTMPATDQSAGVIYAEDVEITCYTLTRTHTGLGNDPTATPAQSIGCSTGQYVAGEPITLTAAPAAGWHVASWIGTDDNAGTSITNTFTMPADAHSVSVTYEDKFNSFIPLAFNNWPQWEAVGTVLTDLYTFIACPTDSNKRFAGARNALYEWKNNAWSQMSNAPLNVRDFIFVEVNDEPCAVLYAASFNGNVWRLTDQGWDQFGTNSLTFARSLALRGATLYVATRSGVFSYDLSSSTETAWQPVLPDANVTRLSTSGERLYAAVFGEGTRFNDSCNEITCVWTEVGTAPFGDAFDVVGSAPEAQPEPEWVVLATARGLYYWDGEFWSDDPIAPPPAGNIFALAQVGQLHVAGVQNGGVWLSDNGTGWRPFPINGTQDYTIIDLIHVPGDGLYAVTPNDGVWHWVLQ